jgi:hypothetical protein
MRCFRKFNFSTQLDKVYDLRMKVKDVVKMRGIGTPEPYVFVDSIRLNFSVDKVLQKVALEQHILN